MFGATVNLKVCVSKYCQTETIPQFDAEVQCTIDEFVLCPIGQSTPCDSDIDSFE